MCYSLYGCIFLYLLGTLQHLPYGTESPVVIKAQSVMKSDLTAVWTAAKLNQNYLFH